MYCRNSDNHVAIYLIVKVKGKFFTVGNHSSVGDIKETQDKKYQW